MTTPANEPTELQESEPQPRDENLEQASAPLFTCWTIPGMREANQDAVAAFTLRAYLFPRITAGLVADGMSGHKEGALAATDSIRIAVKRIISATLAPAGKPVPLDITGAVAAAFYAANAHLIAHVTENPHHAGMGTTLVIAVIVDATLCVANVGDSRCYLARGQTLQQLTHDDSYVQTLVDQNILTREQADNHPRANELSRALGGPRDLDDLAIARHTLCPGDVVLLCSDGAFRGTQDAIRQTCQELALQPFTQAILDEAAMRLVERALKQGSDDNISVVLLWMAPARKPAERPAADEH